jgi:cytochrome b561/polyisoprenoid-binding protein YceI
MSKTVSTPTRALPIRYSTAAIILHWALAFLLILQLSLGWRLETLTGLTQFNGYQLHKSIGITILALSLLRLVIRVLHKRPAPVDGPPALTFLAHAVHVLLYVVMIGGPITGWIMVSTAKVKMQTMLFGTLPVPSLPLGSAWNGPSQAAHSALAWLFVALLFLHVAGALKHHLEREDLLGRMLPKTRPSRAALHAVAVVALLGIVAALAIGKLLPLGGAAAPVPVAVPEENGAEEVTNLTPANAAAIDNAAVAPTAVNAIETATTNAAEPDVKAASPWSVSPGGKLGFRADYSGTAIDGSFKRWDADIVFSPDDLDHSRISVTIDLASADTADSQRDDMLRSDSFFDIATHPRATFTSSKIRHVSGNRYSAAGTLSLHGQSKPLTVDFTLDIAGESATASGTARIARTVFGVGGGEWASTDNIKDDVGVSFRFKAKRKP